MKHSTKRMINQIVDLCLQKQIHCDINMEVFNISIYTKSIKKNAYFYGQFYNNDFITNDTTLTLSDLLKFVKNY